MGLRFHKSISVMKGVKINISKSGPSLSLGKSGMSLNIGKNGVTGNVGLPGTGLSYRKKLLDNPLKPKKKSNKDVGEFHVDMDEMGNIKLLDGKNREIKDTSLVRKIKSTSEYKEEKERLEQMRLEHIDELVEQKQQENNAFINIHELSADIMNEQDYKKIAMTPYKKEVFKEPKPSLSALKAELEEEAKEKITGFFLTVNSAREKYVNDHLDVRYEELMNEYEQAKEQFEENEASKERVYNSYKSILNQKEDEVPDYIDEFISNISLPVDISVSYEYKNGDLLVDLDLPEIENLPNMEYSVGAKGTIKEKSKTQATLKIEYIRTVFGLAVFLASHLFNQSLMIQRILISAYTQRRDKNGNENDEYIYSIKFIRQEMEGKNFSEMDPVSFCQSFENRCNITTNNVMKKIVPFDEF